MCVSIMVVHVVMAVVTNDSGSIGVSEVMMVLSILVMVGVVFANECCMVCVDDIL